VKHWKVAEEIRVAVLRLPERRREVSLSNDSLDVRKDSGDQNVEGVSVRCFRFWSA
jgi:hypothetical protein